MDLFDLAKNIGALLATASACAYVGGYLALRARSFALGTDPAFKLVDQVYVFAGFRFLFITLIVLLLSAPVILFIRWAAFWLVKTLPDRLAEPIQWIGLLMLTIMTLASMSIFRANGVLLRADALPASGLEAAVLGGAVALRLALIFGIVLLAGLSTLWIVNRMTAEQGPFELILAVIVALQVFMLPIYHGELFADRRVRVMSRVPASVRGLVAPVAVVDRTADQATLLGIDGAGVRSLTTIDSKDLNGIPVQKVVPIEDFLRAMAGGSKDASGDTAAAIRGVQMADSRGTTEPLIMTKDTTGFERGFFASLADYLGMVFESVGSLGDLQARAGELWTVELDNSGQPTGAHRVSSFEDISWPVIGANGASYIALQRGRVVRIDARGALAGVLDEGNNWRKLLGVLEDGSVVGLVRKDLETRPAKLMADGTLRVGAAPLTDEDKKTIARLLQEARAYHGGWALVVDRSERGGRGVDVFLRSPGKTYNLSDCGDDYCGQASLTPDFRRVVFVRAPQY